MESKLPKLRQRLTSCTLASIVRRSVAFLLIFLFVGTPALLAVALESTPTDLPACCKKDGAHMCSVRRNHANQKDEKPGLSAVCPFVLQNRPAVLGQRTGISLSTDSSAAPAFERQRVVHSQVLAPTGTPLSGNPKRGPPLRSF